MQIAIRLPKTSRTQALRSLARRRLLYALSRFDTRIERVELSLSNASATRGGLDQLCTVRIQLKGLPEVRVSSFELTPEAGIGRAADRAGKAVARSIKRDRQFDRATIRS